MKINWKVRVKSIQFWIGIIGVVMSPILSYFGLAYSDLTTWNSVGELLLDFIKNPYLVGTVVLAVLSAIGVITDPTTKGFKDSERALDYEEPN